MSVLQLAVQAMADTSTSAPNTDPGAELIAFWILAPLQPGMQPPPHAMAEDSTDDDYYLGRIGTQGLDR